jgi:hypothetical protein
VSAKSVRAYETHRAQQGRPVRAVDVNGAWRRSRVGTARRRSPEPVLAAAPTAAPPNTTAEPTARVGGAREVARAESTELVVLRREALAELVRDAISEALTSTPAEALPALLDRNGLARMLSVGIGTVDRLRREGCPVMWLGDSPRFELAACIEWLRLRGRERP